MELNWFDWKFQFVGGFRLLGESPLDKCPLGSQCLRIRLPVHRYGRAVHIKLWFCLSLSASSWCVTSFLWGGALPYNPIILIRSGELLSTTGKFFEERGYEIKVFNLTDMAHSHCYNPFHYLRGEEDVLTLINCLIKNTESGSKGGADPFWENSEMALLEAIIFYLTRYQKKDRQNFSMVSKRLRILAWSRNFRWNWRLWESTGFPVWSLFRLLDR